MAMLAISQSHLTVLSACERKYQYVFQDALSGPSTYEQQATTEWGSQFHLLMQQRALDLPIEVMTGANAEMSNSLAALAEAAPEVFTYLPVSEQPPVSEPQDGPMLALEAAQSFSPQSFSPQSFSQSEHRRRLAFNGYLLTVIYDWVVCSPQKGQIFDWKTHQRPPHRNRLKEDWQTRLYLYVLCETSDLRPEELSMTYWFVRLGAMPQAGDIEEPTKPSTTDKRPSFYQFDYSEDQHDKTRQDLQQLTDRLTQLLQQADQGIDFPKVALAKGLCDRCPFNLRCDRLSPSAPAALALSPDPYQLLRAASQFTADTVEEIPF